MLPMTGRTSPSSRQSKAEYSFKVVGDKVEISNKGKAITLPLSKVGYNTEFLGNQDGSKVGVIAEIGLSHQQGKSLVGKIKG